MPGRSRSKAPDAVLASLAAHVLLLAGLALSARVYRPPEESPAIQVSIVPDIVDRAQPLPTAPATARTRQKGRAQPLRRPQAATPATSGLPAAEAPPSAQSPDAAADAERLRSVLQGLTACTATNAAQPDAEGRRRCDEQAARGAARPVGPPRADRFARAPQEPLLVRKPHNGCLPRLADRASPLESRGGRSGASTTGGVGCAWSF